MTKQRRPYEPRNPELIPGVDGAILQILPKVGSRVGVKPNARQVKALAKDLKEDGLSSAEISSRLRAMSHEAYGYVTAVTVLPVSHGKGYQITPAGEAFLASLSKEA